MPDFGIFRSFGEKLFGDKLVAGQLPTQLGLNSSYIDADATAFFLRITAAGGVYSSTEMMAINQLVLDMKSAGIWTAMKAIYPMIGASAAACSQNLKSSSFTGTFTSGWTFSSTGVTTNGSSTYFDTNLNPRVIFASNFASFGVYLRNTNSSGTNISGVCDSAILNRFDLGYDGGVTTPFVAVSANTSTVSIDTDNKGFLIATRQGSSLTKLFRNNVLKVTGSDFITVAPIYNFYFGARNLAGVPQYLTNNQNIAFGFIADGLSDSQSANFYTAVQAFQTSLSRQV